ncbi:hypothetical protein ZWY2020_006162 [Hordeum vulgare]|nr:hypothetical protein ZWY2020_006162 [Hordeum vulgare]
MEKVEGLLHNLKLSEKERKGVKIGWAGSGKVGMVEPQALAKLLSEKPVFVEAMAETLGRIWCPIKGLECKEVGENIFLFTFGQESGKRLALEGGPWEFGSDLLVFEEFIASKRPEDYSFDTIPIWVRIMRLPLGMMCKESGEVTGSLIGDVQEVEAGADEKSMGRFLRVKVRMNIKAPLMRGFTLEEEDAEVEQTDQVDPHGKEAMLGGKNWCPFEYEHLPDFCYVCGIIGHTDKACGMKLKKGEKAQFGPWLRAFIPRRGGLENRNRGERWGAGGRSWVGKSSAGWGRRSLSGSNGPSWRKDRGSGAERTGSDEKGQ